MSSLFSRIDPKTKRWLIIAGSFLLLVFLAGRGIYKTIHRIDEEKIWYVGQLNLKSTFRIDSVETFSKRNDCFLFCNLISGEIDNSVEARVNKKLVHHKRIRFLRGRYDGLYLILSRRYNQYQSGDSLQVNSDKDQVIFYRGGTVIRKASVSNFLQDIVF